MLVVSSAVAVERVFVFVGINPVAVDPIRFNSVTEEMTVDFKLFGGEHATKNNITNKTFILFRFWDMARHLHKKQVN